MSFSSTVKTTLINVVVMTLGSAACAYAETAEEPTAAAASDGQQLAPKSVTMSEDLSSRTDKELTALTAQWSQLSASERRRLLAEVRGRMAANQSVRRPVGIKVQRRYGRLVRKSDGTVVVQTRVVQMTPRIVNSQVVTKDGTQRARVTFGIGFEKRAKRRSASEATAAGQQTQAAIQDAPAAALDTLSVGDAKSIPPQP